MGRQIKTGCTPPAGPRPAPEVGLVVDVPAPGGLDALLIREQPIPSPKPDEVLIEVRAAGVNRGDIKQREGNYPMAGLRVTSVLGLEVAG
jgi:NADPH2:quinone reductase